MKNFKYLFFILLTAGIIFTSCDTTVGLGPKLNLEPPAVEIITPEFMENITGETLTIKGTAKDNEQVVYLYVTVEKMKGTPWSRSFVCKMGDWSGDSFVSVKWETQDNKNVEWEIELAVDNSKDGEGEYLISAGAENNVKNKGPVAQRRAIIDKTPPDVFILVPDLEDDDSNSYELRDYAVLDKLHTRELKIQYEIDDNFSVKEFELEIIRKSDEETVYLIGFGKEGQDEAEKYGTIIIKDYENQFLKDVSSGRQSFYIKTTVKDKAGNENLDTHGYLTWWDEAKIPWAEGLTKTDDGFRDLIFRNTPVGMTAYGKFGITQVRYRIDAWNGSSYTAGSWSNPIENDAYGDSDPSSFFNFTFQAPNIRNLRYRLLIETKDIHDNISAESHNTFYFITDNSGEMSPLALRYSGSPPGTYKAGDDIDIEISLREAVNITGNPELVLNTGGVATFDTTTNNSNYLRFEYKVGDSDTTGADDYLNVTAVKLNGAEIKRANGTALPDEETQDQLLLAKNQTGTKYRLEAFRRITIDTSTPSITGHNLSGSVLTLTFNKRIYKGTGNITLTQQGTLLAPAVIMTKLEYENLNPTKADPHPLASYYKAGINGASSAGVVETTEKYILNYDINTNGTRDGSATATNLISDLTNAGAFRVTIPVVSNAVTITGTGNNILAIDLSGAYAPKVKGASYAVEYQKGIVKDNQSNEVDALTGTARTINVLGVNMPYIRVERKSETLAVSGTPSVVRASLNRTASVKFDCQTPADARTLQYSFAETESGRLPSNHNYNGTSHKPTMNTAQAEPADVPATLTLPYDVTGTAKQDSNNGYIYIIRVIAAPESPNAGLEETNYELAARSVIEINTNNMALDKFTIPSGRVLQIWIRGGDQTRGDNQTAGFPLQWSDGCDGKPFNNGARLFTRNSNTSDTWRWMTWEVNVPAYFNFLAGTTDNNEADITANGPIEWAWGVNRWALQHHQFPLFPGSSLYFHTETLTESNATVEFKFTNDDNGVYVFSRR